MELWRHTLRSAGGKGHGSTAVELRPLSTGPAGRPMQSSILHSCFSSLSLPVYLALQYIVLHGLSVKFPVPNKPYGFCGR